MQESQPATWERASDFSRRQQLSSTPSGVRRSLDIVVLEIVRSKPGVTRDDIMLMLKVAAALS